MMNSANKIAFNQVITPKLVVYSFFSNLYNHSIHWNFYNHLLVHMIEKSDTSRYEIFYLQICFLWEVIYSISQILQKQVLSLPRSGLFRSSRTHILINATFMIMVAVIFLHVKFVTSQICNYIRKVYILLQL